MKDSSQREMASVAYVIADNGKSGVVIERAADDQEDSKLNELFDSLNPISQKLY